MNKRKIDINELKLSSAPGCRIRRTACKQETMTQYFKPKDSSTLHVFQVSFIPLISDLLQQLATAEFMWKLENGIKDPMQPLSTAEGSFPLGSFSLKGISKEYPIGEICQCLEITNDAKSKRKILSVLPNKFVAFTKNLRSINSAFCEAKQEVNIVGDYEIKPLYESFKRAWSKVEEKGRRSQCERLQNLICRSVYFLGVLIQNNIYNDIVAVRPKDDKKADEFETKSQKKKKGGQQVYVVSSTYSFVSESMQSNGSVVAKSQRSTNNQPCGMKKGSLIGNSQRIVSRPNKDLFDSIQISATSFVLKAEPFNEQLQPVYVPPKREEISLISNDVENILIMRALNLQRFDETHPRPPKQFNMLSTVQPNFMHHYPVYGSASALSLGGNLFAPEGTFAFVQKPTLEAVRTQPVEDSSEQDDLLKFSRSFNVKKNPPRNQGRKIN